MFEIAIKNNSVSISNLITTGIIVLRLESWVRRQVLYEQLLFG